MFEFSFRQYKMAFQKKKKMNKVLMSEKKVSKIFFL